MSVNVKSLWITNTNPVVQGVSPIETAWQPVYSYSIDFLGDSWVYGVDSDVIAVRLCMHDAQALAHDLFETAITKEEVLCWVSEKMKVIAFATRNLIFFSKAVASSRFQSCTLQTFKKNQQKHMKLRTLVSGGGTRPRYSPPSPMRQCKSSPLRIFHICF